VQEGHFAAEDLLAADEIFLTNSMRGIVSVQRLGDRTWDHYPLADEVRAQYDKEVQLRLQNRLPLRHW
jgi:branched-subunit amino acid aminotransferase/4-amino-4-deoxychorismate lyase